MMDVSIERACERLVLDFAYFSDRQDYEALAALFTKHGTMERPSGDTLIGHDAILESYRSRGAGRITRHICTNIRITVESADRARGLTYAVVYSATTSRPPEAHFGIKADARQLIGEFEDEFVRTAEGWRFASRRARFVIHTEQE
jgi:SnoaL-like protein